MMGLLPFFQASANEQTRNEVRQALLSIQGTQRNGWPKGETPPAPKAPLAPPPEPKTRPRAFPSNSNQREPESSIDFPPEPQAEEGPRPRLSVSQARSEARELQSVQDGLDQLNRESGRFPAGQVPASNPAKAAPPTPFEREPEPPSFPSEKIGLPASFNRFKLSSTK